MFAFFYSSKPPIAPNYQLRWVFSEILFLFDAIMIMLQPNNT